MTTDRPEALRVERHHLDGQTVTIVVVCGFIGCPWSMEIGTAPLEAHQAYVDHLDVHDPDTIADCEAPEQPSYRCPGCEMVSHHPEDVRQGYCGNCHAFDGKHLVPPPPDGAVPQAGPTEYTDVWAEVLTPDLDADHHRGDPQFDDLCTASRRSPDCYVAEHRAQARIDRFMAGGNDA